MGRRVKTGRDEYYHRVKITDGMLRALQSQVNARTGALVQLHMTPTFWFRIVDGSEDGVTRDYGWYQSWEEMVGKLDRLFPELELVKALTDQ